jgi:hypothetical protein
MAPAPLRHITDNKLIREVFDPGQIEQNSRRQIIALDGNN